LTSTWLTNWQFEKSDIESDRKVDAQVEQIERSPAPRVLDSSNQQSYWKTLAPYSGYQNDIKWSAYFIRPFVMVLSPSVAWGTLLFTTSISWLVGISITLSQIFSVEPYNFSINAVGASNLPAFVASVIGMLVASPLLDGTVKVLSKANKGIFGTSLALTPT
jgi:hypothetical protein